MADPRTRLGLNGDIRDDLRKAKEVSQQSIQIINLGPKGAVDRFGRGTEPQQLGAWPSCDAAPDLYEGAPSVACTVNVQLSVDNPTDDDTAQLFDWSDAYLRVKYGSGELDLPILELDLMNGCSFPLVARSAQFELVYPIDASADPASKLQPKIDVSVSIGVGVLGASGARGARRTIKCPTEGQNAHISALLPIPKFAVGAVLQTATTTASGQFNQFPSDVGTGGQQLSISTVQKEEYQSVPVVHGARGFSLSTAAEEPSAKVIFYLSPA
jgi:hypothetical protein